MRFFTILILLLGNTLAVFANPPSIIDGLKSGSFIIIGNVYNSNDSQAIHYSDGTGQDGSKIVNLGRIYIIEQLCDRKTIMFVGNDANQSVACTVK